MKNIPPWNMILKHLRQINKKSHGNRGFTLIELLVVIAIIGLLSATITASLNNARAKARDARRLFDAEQITIALEIYYDDNGGYPPRDQARNNDEPCTVPAGNPSPSYGNDNWCLLYQDLLPYIMLPIDPGPPGDASYWYDADSGDAYQTYGMMLEFESNPLFDLATNDGGFYLYSDGDGGFYEFGAQPTLCQGWNGGSNWYIGNNNVCASGNP